MSSVNVAFACAEIGNNAWAIHNLARGHAATVAVISQQGMIDWLLKTAADDGPEIKALQKEPHLSYVQGFKMQLNTPSPETWPKSIDVKVDRGGKAVRVAAHCLSKNGKFGSDTTALLTVSADGRFIWDFSSTITSLSNQPEPLHWIEYNNVYPGRAGRCFLFAPAKEFQKTILTDAAGNVWKFPHQHLMHHGSKTRELKFAAGTLGGFFNEPAGNPVVIVNSSSIAPDWGICDMYYDLHCGGRLTAPVQPEAVIAFDYVVKYLNAAETAELLGRAKPIPVTEADRTIHCYPRLELGLNHFDRPVNIDRLDDASGFRPAPPKKVWDRETGCTQKGSLRITNDVAEETVWTIEPPSQIPAETTLRIRAKARTQDVTGRGFFVRLKYFTFEWHPTPHCEFTQTLETTPLTGTTDGWVPIEIAELRVPREHFDYLIALEVVLAGKGVGWVTDMDVDLQPRLDDTPSQQAGSTARRALQRRREKVVAGGAQEA